MTTSEGKTNKSRRKFKNCPLCGTSLNGTPLVEHFRHDYQHSLDDLARRLAKELERK